MEFKPIATGFCFLEAPRADERGVWFSDCALGGVRCLRPDGSIDTWLPDRKPIGGLAINFDGAVLCTGSDGIAWFDPATGASGMLLEKVDGAPIGGVNDVIPDSRGGLYFGTLDHHRLRQGEAAGHCGLNYLDTEGQVTRLCGGLKACNGLGLSPDGLRLYHNETLKGTYAYNLSSDGGLGEGVLLNGDLDGDGLAVDREGGVWIANILSRTITRVTPEGSVDRRIPGPGGLITSLCFGGPDWRDLYVTTAPEGSIDIVLQGGAPQLRTASVYQARSDIPGLPVALTRFRLPLD